MPILDLNLIKILCSELKKTVHVDKTSEYTGVCNLLHGGDPKIPLQPS